MRMGIPERIAINTENFESQLLQTEPRGGIALNTLPSVVSVPADDSAGILFYGKAIHLNVAVQ